MTLCSLKYSFNIGIISRVWLLAHRDRPVGSYRVAKPGKLKRRSRGPCDARPRLSKRQQEQRDGPAGCGRTIGRRRERPASLSAGERETEGTRPSSCEGTSSRVRAMLPRGPKRYCRAPRIFSHFKGLQERLNFLPFFFFNSYKKPK